jgi:hypothetical protein
MNHNQIPGPGPHMRLMDIVITHGGPIHVRDATCLLGNYIAGLSEEEVRQYVLNLEAEDVVKFKDDVVYLVSGNYKNKIKRRITDFLERHLGSDYILQTIGSK